MNVRDKRSGLTIIEVLVVIIVIGVLVGLMLPAIRTSGDAARRMSCSNNMKQVGLAIHNYHSAFQQLPMQMGGTSAATSITEAASVPGNNAYRLSGLVSLLPFLEYQSEWEQIAKGSLKGDGYAPMGPAPWTREFEPWQTEFPIFRCPSDPGEGQPAHGRCNIAVCLGDATAALDTGATRWDDATHCWISDRAADIEATGRGVFIPRQVTRFREVLDGLSNTIFAAEIATDLDDHDRRTSASLGNEWAMIHDQPSQCQVQLDSDRPLFWSSGETGPLDQGAKDQKRGFRWADAAALYTGFNTILPPNRELCLAGGESGIGMLTTSSRHPGGTHVLMGDGAVIFITDSIECGDSNAGTVILAGQGPRASGSPSPYRLWGALGTRAQKETIEETLNQ